MDSQPGPSETKPLRKNSRSPEFPTAPSKPKSNRPSSKKPTLQETRKKGKMECSREEQLINQLKQLDLESKPAPKGTGLVFSDAFIRHHCLWDSSHPECPERVTAVMQKMETEGLVSRCVNVETKTATDEDLFLVHTKEYVELMKSTQTMAETELMSLSYTYDSVYIHPDSFNSACLAVGSVLQLVDKVMTSELRNGFSVSRPPGHHAHVDKMNGYCMFNNLAIAARYAQKRHNVKRVLIVDWDVHHGQGIQYIFQEDPSVLYFSVHRYEQGSFWPHTPDSDSTAVGNGHGKGYNINLPWNKTGMKDEDYLSAFQQLLLPVAYEFQPQLVLVAAGFDAAVGDPKGEMSISPRCFAVLTHLLQALANGRVVLSLEGGYNLQSTAECVCACVRALLGEPCPLLTTLGATSDSALMSISQTVSSLYPFWTRLQILEGSQLSEGEGVVMATVEEANEIQSDSPSQGTGLVYDERMMQHFNMWDSHHPESPQRIFRIFSHLEELGLVSRCCRIPVRLATEEEIALCHSSEYIATIKSTESMKPRDLHKQADEYNSIYICTESYSSALLAAGSCFNATQDILSNQVRNAVAVVRPPGHHAERDKACGFCFFNTAALTARYAQALAKKPLRILILDWDVHHGNGTQHMFEEDDSVLYISLHRYEHGQFFPRSGDADYDKVGRGKGRGFNVNIPWNDGKMGDSEYLAAFHMVIMPIARQFNPELVLVSAGFDAARGDPLGGYKVSPEGYAHMTHLLLSLAAGKVLVILEGGYNLNSISESMCMCTSMLLGDAPPLISPLLSPLPSAASTINRVIRAHAPYWSSLRIQIPEFLRLSLPPPKLKSRRSSKQLQNEIVSTKAEEVTQHQEEVQDITESLQSLELKAPSSDSSSSPISVPVGGARKKVRGSPSGSLDGTGHTPSSHVREETTDDTSGQQEPLHVVNPLPAFPHLEKEPLVLPDGINVLMPCKDCSTEAKDNFCLTAYQSPLATVETEDQQTQELTGASAGTEAVEDQTIVKLFTGGQDMEMATLHVVHPLLFCPHLEEVRPVPPGGINVFLPCEDCGTQTENWICLTCYQVFCGRYVSQHMVSHNMESGHSLVLSFSDLSVWCYTCDAYVHNQVLCAAKNAAHLSKFGEDIPYMT